MLILLPSLLTAQQISKAGRILISSPSSYEGTSTKYQVASGSLSLEANYENIGAWLRIHDSKSHILFEKKYRNCINLKVSANKLFSVFFTGQEVIVLNNKTFAESVFPSSVVFDVNDVGEVLLFNATNNTIVKGQSIFSVSEGIHKVQFACGTAYALGRNTLFEINSKGVSAINHQTSSTFFDLQCINGITYVSLRSKSPNGFTFSLQEWDGKELHDLQIKQNYARETISLAKKPIPQRLQNRKRELIRNPMQFANDSSFQAVGNTYNEIQEYSPGSTYLHPGVDLFGDHLDSVRSVKSGYLKAVLTTSGDYHWRVAIANDNGSDSSMGYLYAHLDQNLIPFIVGDTIQESEVIGQLVDFPVTGFVHVHFARIIDQGNTWLGNWWTFDDPLHYMENFIDTIPPVFNEALPGRLIAFKNIFNDQYAPEASFGSDVDFISNVYDQVNATWKCDVYATGYSIKSIGSTTPYFSEKTSFVFDYFNDTYFSGDYHQTVISTMYQRDDSCFSTGNYNERSFYHIISNSNEDDTITMEDQAEKIEAYLSGRGDYMITVWAEDAYGNRTVDSMIFNLAITGINTNKRESLVIYPNPSQDVLYFNAEKENQLAKIYASNGSLVKTINLPAQQKSLRIHDLPNGLYVLQIGNKRAKFIKE